MDVFDLFGVEEEEEPSQVSPEVAEALRDLAKAVQGLTLASQDYRKAPDLSEVALTVQGLLEAAGHPAAAAAAFDWFLYENSGRRASKIEEARARADAMYRADLEAITDGWDPLYLVDDSQTKLAWRRQASGDGSGGTDDSSN